VSPRAIVCLRRFEELEETLAVRNIHPGDVLALGGRAALGGAAASLPAGAAEAGRELAAYRPAWPFFDIRDAAAAQELCRLVLATAGIAAPAPRLPSAY
jgi:hypothetical protein